jgi:hypothetical protein
MTDRLGQVLEICSDLRVSVARLEEHQKLQNGNVARNVSCISENEGTIKDLQKEVKNHRLLMAKYIGIATTLATIAGTALTLFGPKIVHALIP